MKIPDKMPVGQQLLDGWRHGQGTAQPVHDIVVGQHDLAAIAALQQLGQDVDPRGIHRHTQHSLYATTVEGDLDAVVHRGPVVLGIGAAVHVTNLYLLRICAQGNQQFGLFWPHRAFRRVRDDRHTGFLLGAGAGPEEQPLILGDGVLAGSQLDHAGADPRVCRCRP